MLCEGLSADGVKNSAGDSLGCVRKNTGQNLFGIFSVCSEMWVF